MTDRERSDYLRELWQKIVDQFNKEELQNLAFAVGIDWDELAGEQKSSKARSLISTIDRSGKINKLVSVLRQQRQDEEWPDIPAISQRDISKSPLLRVGSRGEAVLHLQKLLRSLGHSQVDVDGIFGPDTRSAVIRFQEEAGLPADGIVGRQTWATLREQTTAK